MITNPLSFPLRGAIAKSEDIKFKDIFSRAMTILRGSLSTPYKFQPQAPAKVVKLANLLTYSSNLANPSWVKTDANIVQIAQLDLNDDLLNRIEASTASAQAFHVFTSIAGEYYTAALDIYAGGVNTFDIELVNQGVILARSRYDLGNLTATAIAGTPAPSIAYLGGGRYRCTSVKYFSAGNTNDLVSIFPGLSGSVTPGNFITVIKAGVFKGSLTPEVIEAQGGIPDTLDLSSVHVTYSDNLVTNGNFSEGLNAWHAGDATLGVVNGNLEGASSASSNLIAYQSGFVVQADKKYRVTANAIASNSASALRINGASIVGGYLTAGRWDHSVTGVSGNQLEIVGGDVNSTITIDDICIREVFEIHCPVYCSDSPISQFQGSAGNARTTVTGDPIGLLRDVAGTLGDNLITTNYLEQAFWPYRGGTYSFPGSSVHFIAVSDRVAADFTVAPGNTYVLTVDMLRTGSAFLAVDDDGVGAGVGSLTLYATEIIENTEITFVATASTRIRLIQNGVGTLDVYALTLRNFTGLIATQPTAINRPTLERGLWNLLMYSQDFSQPPWGKTNCTAPANSAPDPFGGNTATLVTTTTTAFTTMSQGVGEQSSTTALTEVLWLRAGTVASLDLALYDGVSFTGGSSQSATIISGPGSVIQALGSLYAVSGLSATDWTQVLVTRTGYGSATGSFLIYPRNSGSSNAGDTLIFYRAGLFQGTLTAAQILQQGGIPLTTSAAGSNPDAGSYWSRFNGTNSSLVLGAIPYRPADDFAIIACFNVSKDNNTIIDVCGSGGGPRSGQLSTNAGKLSCTWQDDANTVITLEDPGTSVVGTTIVATVVQRAGVREVRRNGVRVAGPNSTVLGATTAIESVIGRTAWHSNFTEGALYSSKIFKGCLTDAELFSYECEAGLAAGLVLNPTTATLAYTMPSSHSYPFATLQGAYQTSAGPAAVAVNGPIGLELDAMGTVGPELLPSGLTGATVNTGASIVGGSLVMVATAPGYVAFIDGTSGFVAGNWYKVATSSIGVTGNCQVLFQGSAISGVVFGTAVTEMYFVAPSITNSRIQVNNNTGGSVDGTVSVSIKQVTGNHATQTTAINRPTVQRGLWNLLTYSQDLTGTNWATNSSATVSASSVTFAALDTSEVYQITTPSGGTASKSFTVAALISCASGTVPFRLKNTQGGVADHFSGEFIATTTPQLFVFAYTNGGSAGSGSQIYGIENSAVTPVVNTLVVGGCAMFQGTLTADQILAQGGIPLTTSAAGSNPTAGPYYASFNGTNSFLALTSVPFQTNDDFCVVACVKETGSATGGVFSVSTGVSVTELITLSFTGGAAQFYMSSGGSTALAISVPTYADQTIVMVMWKVGTSMVLRVNGVQVASSTWLGGTSTFTRSDIGCYYPGGGLMPQAVYDLDPIKGTLTLAQVVTLERAAAQRAGLVL